MTKKAAYLAIITTLLLVLTACDDSIIITPNNQKTTSTLTITDLYINDSANNYYNTTNMTFSGDGYYEVLLIADINTTEYNSTQLKLLLNEKEINNSQETHYFENPLIILLRFSY